MLKSSMLVAAFFGGLTLVHAQQPPPKPDAPAAKPAAEKKAMLSVGDKAPALAIEKWVKGSPVASFEKGKVYMVEFWATWCGPCIASMPHVTELQKEYAAKGLTVIGVTSADKRGNSLEKVEAMVAQKGDTMGYTVAWDTERQTSTAFLTAAGQNGIPCSFLVDQNGVIAYIGHPMSINDTLAQVMAGKHDIKALAAAYKIAQEREAKVEELSNQLGAAMKNKEFEAALKVADEMMAVDPEQSSGLVPFQFNILANEIKDLDRAYKFAGDYLSGKGKDNAEGLNGLAWMMVDPEATLARRDLPLAQKIAERAVELSKNKNAAILDTLARVHFTKGDITKAIEIQTQAVALDKMLEDTLKEYQEAAAKKGG